MSDPYRSAAFRCLHCPDAPLRELSGERLVCAHCGGILLALEALIDSVGEMTTQPLRVADDTRIAQRCPRCDQRLQSCTLEVGPRTFEPELRRCETHGVWFDPDQLAALFEWISRGEGPSPGRRRGDSAPLQIHHKRRRPTAYPMFATAHAGEALACPVCLDQPLAYGAGRWTCGRCRGLFVEDAALATMLASMTNAPGELPPPSGAPGSRACPLCASAMRAEPLEAVPVDRCDGHGVWFDEAELEEALARAGEPPPSRIRRWVKDLLS